MGRDIHVVLEKKTEAGWEYLETEFTAFDCRNYPFFDFINRASERGCPPELKNRQLRPYTDYWEGRVAGPKVIITYDWDTTTAARSRTSVCAITIRTSYSTSSEACQ